MLTRTVARLDSFAASPAGPVVIALALAMVSLPIVALTLHVYPVDPYFGDWDGSAPDLAWTDSARWLAAIGAVVASALVAGAIGGLWRRHRRLLRMTFVIAWIVAVAATPLLPELAGRHVGFGGPVCIDSCWAPINTSAPTGAPISAVLFWWLGPLAGEIAPFVVLSAGFTVWLKLIARIAPQATPPSPSDRQR